MLQNTNLKLFHVLVSIHRTGYIVTNDLAQLETSAAEEKSEASPGGIRFELSSFIEKNSRLRAWNAVNVG